MFSLVLRVAWAQLRFRPARNLVPVLALVLLVGAVLAEPRPLPLLTAALFALHALAVTAVARRDDLGTLSVLGWRPGALVGTLLAECALIGAVAGVLGGLLLLVFGADIPAARTLLALPLALAAAPIAAAAPAAWVVRNLTAVAAPDSSKAESR